MTTTAEWLQQVRDEAQRAQEEAEQAVRRAQVAYLIATEDS